MKFMHILGVKVSVTDLDRACAALSEWIRQKRRAYVCVCPVSTIVECRRDPQYRDIVNQADLVTPDGVPLVWLGRARGFRDIRRTYGPDLMRRFCDLGRQKGYRHYLYGGTPEALARLQERLTQLYPDILIAGSYSPPFRSLSAAEDEDIITMINQARPDVLWVGLGSPKQDYWMHRLRPRLDVPVMVGVGAAFDFISGAKRQCPSWLQRCGLEWLFRLCTEPRRLWRRYLIGNTQFVFWLAREALSRKGPASKMLSSQN